MQHSSPWAISTLFKICFLLSLCLVMVLWAREGTETCKMHLFLSIWPSLLPVRQPWVQMLEGKYHSFTGDTWGRFTKNHAQHAGEIAQCFWTPAQHSWNESKQLPWNVHLYRHKQGIWSPWLFSLFPYFSNSDRHHLNQTLHFKSCPFLRLKKTNPWLLFTFQFFCSPHYSNIIQGEKLMFFM